MPIQSDKFLAAFCAQAISSGGADILACSEPTRDEETTLQGNLTAQSNIRQNHQISAQIGQQVQTFVDLVHSIADDFEATDARLRQKLTR